MVDLRRIAIIFVIAVLYAVLVNAIIDAIYPAPNYEDYCKPRFYAEKIYPQAERQNIRCPAYKAPTQQELDDCADQKGDPNYSYDANGCPTEYRGCNFCKRDFDNENQKYSFYVFIISSSLALIAVMIGLFLPSINSLNEWIATGFMLGGLISLFSGTFRYYRYLGRYIKPIVILVELLIVIYLSYKKLMDVKDKTKSRKR